MQNLIKKTGEKFDERFSIGTGCNCKNEVYQYAGMKGKNGECENISNRDIKQFIKQAQINIVKEVLKKMPLERTEKWQDMTCTFYGDINDIKKWRDKILKELN